MISSHKPKKYNILYMYQLHVKFYHIKYDIA